jgi:DNA polymerase V
MTVKRIRRTAGRLYLAPENDEFKPLEITEGSEFQVWGVVTSVIHKL